MTAELDALSELRFLTEALRAHAEWQQACGAGPLPAAPTSELRARSSELVVPGPAAAPPTGAPRAFPPAAVPASLAPQLAARSSQLAAPDAAPADAARSSPLAAEERQQRLTVL